MSTRPCPGTSRGRPRLTNGGKRVLVIQSKRVDLHRAGSEVETLLHTPARSVQRWLNGPVSDASDVVLSARGAEENQQCHSEQSTVAHTLSLPTVEIGLTAPPARKTRAWDTVISLGPNSHSANTLGNGALGSAATMLSRVSHELHRFWAFFGSESPNRHCCGAPAPWMCASRPPHSDLRPQTTSTGFGRRALLWCARQC